ncbi:MAG: cytochrome c oxidase accessory protein CcoG [Rhodospirillales bacterium]|nr:cytochrome c oxidase accessory protein CcoG [Rhodospirillales bacterium]
MDDNSTTPHIPQTPSLYAKHVKVYPQRIAGTFRRIKWLVLGVLLGLYYVVPWIRWDRGVGNADQAVLADIAGRRLYFFNIEIWPQEIYYLTGLLVLGAIALFLATAVAGRVWCGFTCPQTVWTDLFMLVERYIEGDRNKRMKLDNGPLTFEKAWRKLAKHAVWIFIAFATGGAWIFYFTDAPTALTNLLTGEGSTSLYGFTALFAGFTYLLAGVAREQVCTYMCPWPRFQGAMYDEDTLIVTYETWRGEPRGKAKDDKTLGDCIDCNLCVNVCPVGIDIRQGSQFQCIGCALCVDACNSVMEKLDRPLNLITYDSIINQAAREHGRVAKKRLIRPRTIAYVVLLSLVGGLMTYGLVSRSTLEINVQRDRAPMFVTLSDGAIRNGYTFKILNMINAPRTYTLKADNLDGAMLTVIGIAEQPVEQVTLHVGPDQVGTFHVFVRAPLSSLEDKLNDFEFKLDVLETGEEIEYDSIFAGPDH